MKMQKKDENITRRRKPGIIINAHAGRKGITTDEEAHGTDRKNHRSGSTHMLQPEATILKLVGCGFCFFFF